MARNTITIKGQGVRNERIANATIKPGALVELMSTGKLRAHATAGGNAQTAFAVEDDLQGKGIGDNYAADAKVQYNIFAPGDQVYAWLANGQDVAVGDFLESAGGGEFRAFTSGVPVAVAVEAVDMSDSDGADPSGRIIVEVL